MLSSTSTALVSTPQKAVAAFVSSKAKTPAPATETFPPSPGTFRHPRLAEIIARQSTSTFTSHDLQNVLINTGVLVVTFVASGPLQNTITALLSSEYLQLATLALSILIIILRLVLLANVVLSLRPAIPYLSKKDEVADIPLTPSQRALLGLDPSISSNPATAAPGEPGAYITPPRYRHTSGTSTPNSQFSDRRSISANYSTSPLSTSRYTIGFSPSSSQTPSSLSEQYRRSSGGTFSASMTATTMGAGSPLMHKVVTQNNSATNNFDMNFMRSTSNLGTSTATSGLGRSQSLRERDRRGSAPFESVGPGTPSPSSRKAVAGMNYKWLYDKGSRLPKSESMGF